MPRGAEAAQSNTQPPSQIFRRPQIYIAQQSLATLALQTTYDTFSHMPELPNPGVALVTGAAKRLGRAVALRLAEEGCDVVIHYRSSESEARDVVSEVEKLGRRALAVSADLAQVAAIKNLFEQAAQHFRRLDILINSAANFLETPFAQVTEADWDRALDSNL